MLSAMNEHDLRVLIDLVDHPELTASSRAEPVKLAPERLPCPVWVLGDRPEDRFDDCSATLGRRPVEMRESLSRGCLAPGCADGLGEHLVRAS